jgi:hypothetical protein
VTWSAVQRDAGRDFSLPPPTFDACRRQSDELADLKVVEQRIVTQPIEDLPDVRLALLAPGRHHVASPSTASISARIETAE